MWIMFSSNLPVIKNLGSRKPPRLLHGKTGLPETPTVAMNTQKRAHKAPTIDKRRKPLFLLLCFFAIGVVTGVPLAFPLNLIRLKLDIRTNVRLRGPSLAEAGVEGIESINAHKADENELVSPPFWPSWSWAFTLTVGFVESGITPKQRWSIHNESVERHVITFKDLNKRV